MLKLEEIHDNMLCYLQKINTNYTEIIKINSPPAQHFLRHIDAWFSLRKCENLNMKLNFGLFGS